MITTASPLTATGTAASSYNYIIESLLTLRVRKTEVSVKR